MRMVGKGNNFAIWGAGQGEGQKTDFIVICRKYSYFLMLTRAQKTKEKNAQWWRHLRTNILEILDY